MNNSTEVFGNEAQKWIDRSERACDAILKMVDNIESSKLLWDFCSRMYGLSRESHKLGDCFAEIGSRVFHQAKELQSKRNEELGVKYPGSFADVAGDRFVIDKNGFLRLGYKSSFENKSKKQIKRYFDKIKYKQEEK